MFKPRDIAEMVRSALKRQGYDHDPARRKFFPQNG